MAAGSCQLLNGKTASGLGLQIVGELWVWRGAWGEFESPKWPEATLPNP